MATVQSTLSLQQATTEEDIREAAPLFDLYCVFYKQRPDAEASLAFLHERWIARESVLYLARKNGAAVGFVQLYPLFDSDKKKRLWLLNDLFVAQEARRLGVARALMRRAEQHARETRSAGLLLTTAVDNFKGQALYEGEGYVRDAGFFHYHKLF